MRNRRLKRYLIANVRDLRVLFREFRVSLLLFVVLILGVGGIFALLYVSPATGQGIDLGEALYAVFGMIFFQDVIGFPAEWYLRVFFFIVPILGLGVIADGVLRFGAMLFNKRNRLEEWQVAVASTYRDHVVVCGVGRVGYRVVRELLRLDVEVVAIEVSTTCVFVNELREQGVPIIVGDARHPQVLRQAGADRARAIVVATEDDPTNLEIALNAREMNPAIRVVLRLFNETLAEKVSGAFDIQTAFSTSALAAPAFAAAATRADVTRSLYVDDMLLNLSQVTVAAGSRLAASTVGDVEQGADLSVVLYHSADGTRADFHPADTLRLASGDRLTVFASLEALGQLDRLNTPAR
ncbi:MAG: NAD-binding protein [Chloroflexi bacterium]|nr:NAD-binding protein [Chloroflexota bacterium]MBU1746286.1 NAD-binding protein [Chloroflexota bacterium]